MVNEKDLQSYLKIAAPALPCRTARKEFSSYVHNVARDISIENPDADFETIANMLGVTSKQAAVDFVECQSAQTISQWSLSAKHILFATIDRNSCCSSLFCSNLFCSNERSDGHQH